MHKLRAENASPEAEAEPVNHVANGANRQTIARLQSELGTCHRTAMRNLDILEHLHETNKKLNVAIAAQGQTLGDLRAELERQAAEIHALHQEAARIASCEEAYQEGVQDRMLQARGVGGGSGGSSGRGPGAGEGGHGHGSK